MPRTRLAVAALALSVLAVGHATWAAWQAWWTHDERFHLEWTQRLLDTGAWERESVPRYNSKTPVVLPNVIFWKAAQSPSGHDRGNTQFRLWAARLPSVGWLAALLAGTFLLGRRLFGPDAASLATIACALDPNLVAHGSLVTVDCVYALAALATVAAAVRFASVPTAVSAVVLGAALGFALTAKFTAVLLLPTVAIAFVQAASMHPRWAVRLRLAAAALLAVVAVICAAYLFTAIAAPFASLPLHSRPFVRLAAFLPGLRLPLPAPFLTGLDQTLTTERGEWNVVILGRFYPHGVWYYFVVHWALKTPLLLLAATAIGLLVAARTGIAHRAPLISATLVVHLVYFSFFFRAQIGYRFVLACVPLAYLLAAAGLAPMLERTSRRAALVAAATVAILENAMYTGNPLSFTNAAVWPKRSAFRFVADSNLDWGQNREKIDGWLEAAGVPLSRFDPPHFVPGYNVFGVNNLAGVRNFERYRFLREHAAPAGHYGHTYAWFDVSTDLFNRFMDEGRRLTPTAAGPANCESIAYSTITAGGQEPFSSPGLAGRPQSWVVCVAARKTTDVGLRAENGQLRLGVHVHGAPCAAELVGSGQSVWYRLEPGVHAFCMEEIPSRRPFIPFAFDATWIARGHGVGIGRREATAVTAPTPPPPAGSIPRSSSPPQGPEG